MRIFLAAEFSREVRKDLFVISSRKLQHAAPLGRCVLEENLHLTLVFLGETGTETIAVLTHQLRKLLAARRSISLQISGMGAFPDAVNPRVLWAGVQQPNEHLSSLQRDVERVCKEIGFSFDARPFHPHITLMRCSRKQGDVSHIIESCQENIRFEAVISSVVLFASQSLPDGRSRYTPIAIYPLGS